MKKRILAMLLLLVFVVGNAPAAFAHRNQNEHDKDLKYVLFGSEAKKLSGDEKLIFKAIANAAALAIDQFSADDQLRWKEKIYDELQEELKKLHASELPYSFEELDLNSNVSSDGKNVTANSHRMYTHLGWNYKGYPNEEFWEKRKQVLVHTVNWTLYNDKAFFSWVPGAANTLYPPNEQCEAFCAVVYYIHILGDHMEGDISKKLAYLEPIQYVDSSAPGIITELKEQLQILFKSQSSSWSYAGLMDAITTIEIESNEDYKTWGKLDTKEKCKINQEYADKIMDVLSAYLPNMLKNEPFFSSHFK